MSMWSNIFDQPGKATPLSRLKHVCQSSPRSRSLWPDDFGDEHNEIDVVLTMFYESLKTLTTTSTCLTENSPLTYDWFI